MFTALACNQNPCGEDCYFVFIVYHISHVPHGNEKRLIHIIVNWPNSFCVFELRSVGKFDYNISRQLQFQLVAFK